ncbi:glycosyltransferase family 2 protein [Kocuria sp.]|uniref:glycosyltransferase family 2 protein n=1 Tax=Kocuria sp. TaxID=1871328 RepID=UPI0026DCB6D6|nr:glycosyltransferase [Kocuria sp.]MDO4918811.1 glycosyltransferase [Kocuria sp.]
MPPTQILSVIIPTLQRARELPELVELCAEHPAVREVIVVNNHQSPLDFGRENVRVLQQEQNIFVNPAWNLGVREAVADHIALINDDVLFDPVVLDIAAEFVLKPRRGILGLEGTFINRQQATPAKLRIAGRDHISSSFGMFMCLRKENYVPVPEDLLVWCGDDWLFLQQPWPNWVLMGPLVRSEVSVTSSAGEFQRMVRRETELADTYLRQVYGTRWWHRPVDVLVAARRQRARLRSILARLL